MAIEQAKIKLTKKKKKITKSNHSQSYRLEAEKHIENTQRFYSIAHMKDAKKKKKAEVPEARQTSKSATAHRTII